MKKRVTNPQKLGELIDRGDPGKVVYSLGTDEKRTELLITYDDNGSKMSSRIASDPIINLYRAEGNLRLDISDSDTSADKYSFQKLPVQGTKFNKPNHPEFELGDLEINLGEGKQIAISQFYRTE